jgi:hypothetical protein
MHGAPSGAHGAGAEQPTWGFSGQQAGLPSASDISFPAWEDAQPCPTRNWPQSTYPFPLRPLSISTSCGIVAGIVQIELAARALQPLQDGRVDTPMIETGRLRCSPTAAKFLKDSLEAALKMLEQPISAIPGNGKAKLIL